MLTCYPLGGVVRMQMSVRVLALKRREVAGSTIVNADNSEVGIIVELIK